jgi:predicted NUDIX family NTP pyrophosphohydrolase
MPVRSAGILLFRRREEEIEVLLAHPGGPLWAKRDLGAWSIPKGEYDHSEDPEAAARREFAEEIGSPAPAGPALWLGEIRQKSGKRVVAWGIEGDLDAARAHSNTFELEWPPKSGQKIEVPEIDRAEWFGLDRARQKLNPAQLPLMERLVDILDSSTVRSL